MNESLLHNTMVIIGIGNEFRSDDSVGLVVARQLQKEHLPDVCVLESSGDGTELMEMWRGYSNVVLVDAVVTGAAAGSLFQRDAHHEHFTSDMFSQSTHMFGIAEAIELSRSFRTLPQHCTVFGVEGKNFSFGIMMSDEVSNAVPLLAEKIKKCVMKHCWQ